MRHSREFPRSMQRQRFVLSESNPVRAMAHTHHERGAAPLFDIHYEMELGIVLSGRMRRLYRGFETVCGAGDVWLCGLWEPHGYAVEQVPCRVLVLVIWPPLLAGMSFPECPAASWMSLFAMPPGKRPRPTAASRASAAAAAGRIVAAAEQASPFAGVRIRLALTELLADLMERAPAPVRKAGRGEPGVYGRISRAIDMVFEAGARLSVRQAAAACGMNRDKFAREFHDMMGMPFAKFALQHRVSRAAEQLASTDKPIKLVAYEMGFSDESHLNRVFLRQYSCAPGEFRRRARAGADRPAREKPGPRKPRSAPLKRVHLHSQ